MKLTALLTANPPMGLHVVRADESRLCDLSLAVLTAHPRAAVRTLRGRKSRTRAAFFDESAAALQFPYFFGENWDAFDEVIGELQWVPADAYLLLLSSADLLLSDAPEGDVATLLAIFRDLHASHRASGRPFHVVAQCATSEALATFTTRARAAACEMDTVEAA